MADLMSPYAEALRTALGPDGMASFNRVHEAVLAVRDDELADALRRAERAEAVIAEHTARLIERGTQAWYRERDRARELHARDDSNPRGPWCGTCMTPWPCSTWTALDVPADGEQAGARDA